MPAHITLCWGQRDTTLNPTRPTSAPRARLAVAALALLAVSACGSDGSGETALVVRDPDDVQVLTPAEVQAFRGDATASNGGPAIDPATGDTIPLEEADPTERLFTAFGELTDCMDEKGQEFKGDPRSDPALLEDTAYMDAISTCAARSDILGALTAFQEFNEGLTPDEVEERNEDFLVFSECLKDRGWTVEAAPNAKGLLSPSVFQSADGTLNERDLRQCGSEIETDG